MARHSLPALLRVVLTLAGGCALASAVGCEALGRIGMYNNPVVLECHCRPSDGPTLVRSDAIGVPASGDYVLYRATRVVDWDRPLDAEVVARKTLHWGEEIRFHYPDATHKWWCGNS